MIQQIIHSILPNVQKPGRYCGGELNSIVKDKSKIDLRFAFCFPDIYEIGMSHLGMKILYSLLNSQQNIWCERVFAPEDDMAIAMKQNDIPLYALESKDSIKDFDIIGFTLQYELSYTTVLYMLQLAGVEIQSSKRQSLKNIVVAGGPCTCNPEPMADFIDVFFLGESEETILKFCELYSQAKNNNFTKQQFLMSICNMDGIYVPSFYEVEYNGQAISTVKANNGAPAFVKKSFVADLDKIFYPESFVVPFIDIVHDRAVQEIFRGCSRSCRFCQAGFIYRPVREKSPQCIIDQAKSLTETSGYDELSLASLSTSDYTKLPELLNGLIDYTNENKISLSLPSLRIDNFSDELLEKVKTIRKTGLTFAPEAGTQRLRDIINKNITEEDILSTCKKTFESGYTKVKLYFMLGLPFETDEDVIGIAILAQKIVEMFYTMPNKPKGKGVDITVSVSTFVPKPFTPFQFVGQNSIEEITRKQKLLRDNVTTKKIRVKWHEASSSMLEAAFARGGRNLGKVIATAFEDGCFFDSWDNRISINKWMDSFAHCNINPQETASKFYSDDEILPWDHINYFIDKSYLIKELRKAENMQLTESCKEQCTNCGIKSTGKDVCNN